MGSVPAPMRLMLVRPYQPWYHINCPNGHRSFPVGPHSRGTTLAALAIVLRPLGGKAWRIALWVGTVWGILMAASRVIIGAHWATDTVASFHPDLRPHFGRIVVDDVGRQPFEFHHHY